MFAPDGYVPFSTLWQEFEKKHGLTICGTVLLWYQSCGGHQNLDVGSPADVLEDAFIESFDEYTLYLCFSGAEPQKVQPKDPNRPFRLLDRLNVIESSEAAGEYTAADQSLDQVMLLGSHRFKPWDDVISRADTWATEYSIGQHSKTLPGELPYHRLPYSFVRHRFMIPDALPPWTQGAFDALYLPFLKQSALGRTVCLDLASAGRWKKHVLSANWTSSISFLDKKLGNPGRTRKQEDARGYYEAMFPNGHTCSWKEVRRAILKESGFDASERTYQRAIKKTA